MAKKKNNYYAVKNGHETGIFDNWTDCSKQVHGFKGAIYKGFELLKDAEDYFSGQEFIVGQRFETEAEVMAHLNDGEMIAYVDGSNLGDGSAFSWGIVTFSNKLGRVDLNGMSTNPDMIGFRNVAGELFASVKATKFAIKNGFNKISLYHDYSGIRHFALNEWELENSLAVNYEQYYRKIEGLIEYEFVKVAGHTDDIFNDEADRLAKEALGIQV